MSGLWPVRVVHTPHSQPLSTATAATLSSAVAEGEQRNGNGYFLRREGDSAPILNPSLSGRNSSSHTRRLEWDKLSSGWDTGRCRAVICVLEARQAEGRRCIASTLSPVAHNPMPILVGATLRTPGAWRR